MIYIVLRTKKLKGASILAPELAAWLPAEEPHRHHQGPQAPDAHDEQVPSLEPRARGERVEDLVHRLGEMADREDVADRAQPFRSVRQRDEDVRDEQQRKDDRVDDR